MKKMRIILLLSLSFLFFGCSSAMDAPNDGRLETMGDVFSHYMRIKNLLVDNQSRMAAPVGNGFEFAGLMLASYCDEAQDADQNSDAWKWYRGQVDARYMPTEGHAGWSFMFTGVNNCNTALSYLRDPDFTADYGEDIRSALCAQFYSMRAFFYLQLVKRWGGVPIISRPYATQGYDYSRDRRASFAACADFIIASCDSALVMTDNTLSSDKGFEWRVSSGTSEHGFKLSRAVVWAIKSEAALYAASPLWAADCAGTEPYTWERSARICKDALDVCLEAGYRLFDSSTAFPVEGCNPYDSYFLSEPSFAGGWDKETIYSPFNGSLMRTHVWSHAGLPIVDGQVSAGPCPTQELVDAYDVLDESGTKAAPLLVLSKPYDAEHRPNINPEAIALGYTEDDPYVRRDPRFYATIWYDGAADHVGGAISTVSGGNCGWTASAVEKRYTRTGYYLRKCGNPGSRAGNGQDGYWRTFRLAELYLNFAEAAAQAFGPDVPVPAEAATSASALTSREALNAVRARIGMPPVQDAGADYMARLRGERRVEFAFEEQRFYDVRRWQQPDGSLETTDRRLSARLDGRRTLLPERFCYENKYLRLAIGEEEAIKMEQLTGLPWQNPGW